MAVRIIFGQFNEPGTVSRDEDVPVLQVPNRAFHGRTKQAVLLAVGLFMLVSSPPDGFVSVVVALVPMWAGSASQM